MNREDAIKRLRMVLEYHSKGILSLTEVELELCELAVYFDAVEYLAMLPDPLRRELAKIAESPLPRREDWSFIEGVCVRPERIEAYQREKRAREDRQYVGICKLHKYFTDDGNVVD
jgi:hypothetical protein